MLRFSEITNETILGAERKVLDAPKKYDATERVLIIDGDSMYFFAIYGSEENLQESKFKLRSKMEEVVNEVEKYFNITQTIVFTGGKNNFRKEIYPRYKSHRPEPLPIIAELREYAINELNFIPTDGYEADDGIYTAWLAADGNCIVATNDKDMLANMHGIFYNYASRGDVLGKFVEVSEKEMKLNFARLVMLGDNGDGINLSPGIGPKYAEKTLNIDMSDYQYTKAIYQAYLKAWKDDDLKAREALRMCHRLVKLYDIKNDDIP